MDFENDLANGNWIFPVIPPKFYSHFWPLRILRFESTILHTLVVFKLCFHNNLQSILSKLKRTSSVKIPFIIT